MDIVDLWEDALREYAERTGTDLATDPFTIQLKECDSVKSIMDILDEHTKAFSTFRKGDAKIKLLRTLKPIVTAVLALGPSETLGEGISVHWQPAKAVVGAIVVLLRATKNVSLSYDSLVELLQCVSQFLGRTTIYTRMSLTIQMREILVKMLTNVISILALATKEVKQGRLRKFVRTLLGNTDVEDALTQLTRLSTTETQMVGLESLRLMSDLVASLNEHMKSSQESTGHVRGALKDIRSSMDAVGEVLNKIKDDSIARKHRSWLSPPDPSINHNVALRSYSNGTGTWFTDGDVMGEWKTTNSLLWIHGIPGSGKTILCTAIIEDTRRLCLIQENCLLAYFYCDFQDAAKQNSRGILSHLLVQFSAVSHSCSQLLSGLWSSHSSGSQQPNERDLLQCLKTMLELLSDQDLYVIIDALDECPDDSLEEHSKRHGVLKLICEIIGWGSQNLHMCVSSRPEPDIRAALEALSPCAVSLHAEDGQAHEISAYVSSVIESQSAFQRWKPQDRALAIARLSEKANGMFRWAFCQLEMLRGCLPATIRRVLDDLPKTLDETYRRVLLHLDTPSWEYTHRLFQCLTICARPLRIAELAEILAIDFDPAIPQLVADWRPKDPKGDILSMCSSLIVIDSKTETVQFAHFSVQEYFVSQRLASDVDDRIHRFHIPEEYAHFTFAKACLGVLLQLDDTIIAGNSSTTPYPLSAYAAQFWMEHAKAKNVETGLREAMELAFDPRRPHYSAWSRLHNSAVGMWRFKKIPHSNPLYCVSLHSFYITTEYLLSACAVEVDAQDKYYGPALQVASREGHLDVARLLIEHSADVNAVGGYYETALQAASYHGHLDIVHLLVERGADVNAVGGYYGTALQGACVRGHFDIVCLLMERGADVSAVGGYHGTALQAASSAGRLDIVSLLIERGADINTKGGEDGTALRAASSHGHLDVVCLLMEHGADVNAKGGFYGTALHAASLRGHLEVTRLLINHGADVNVLGGHWRSALRAASLDGHLEVVRLLIEHGADVVGKIGGHALDWASYGGHLETARLLLSHGAGARNDALNAASSEGHLEVAKLLIEHGADVNAKGYEDGTALQAASTWGHLEVARLLIEHGADVNAQDEESGWTALHGASLYAHLEVARLLIEHGADVNAQDCDGETVFQYAMYEKNLRLIADTDEELSRKLDEKRAIIALLRECGAQD